MWARGDCDLEQHIDASGGFRTLAELALASAAHCKPPPLPTSGDATAAAGDFAQRHAPPEPWEGALWLLGELTALGTRSGRETSGVKELAGLLRACSADALAVFGGHVAAAGALAPRRRRFSGDHEHSGARSS